MKVVVVGGGIGGLALAAGLRRHGIEVVVLERDTDLRATGGYHITLQRNVQDALRELLEPGLLERVLASAADGRRRGQDVLWDRHGRLIGRIPLKGVDPGVDVDRVTLRLLLADGVGDSLRPGAAVTGHEVSDGGAAAVLADGTRVEGDLLVAADGVHSGIARALAGGPTNVPAGIVGVSGRTRVAALEPALRDRLGERSSLAVGSRATALYLGYLDPVGHAVLDAPALRASVTVEPTFIWGAMFPDREADALRALRDGALRDAVLDRLRAHGWGPRLLDVLARSESDGVRAFRFHAAPADPRLQAPWPSGRVTALGDAVHATPPTAGMGAGAAIRDAAALVSELSAGHQAVPVAVHRFEADMRERGAEVVGVAMRTVRQVLATDSAVGAALTRAATPVLAAATGLRRSA